MIPYFVRRFFSRGNQMHDTFRTTCCNKSHLRLLACVIYSREIRPRLTTQQHACGLLFHDVSTTLIRDFSHNSKKQCFCSANVRHELQFFGAYWKYKLCNIYIYLFPSAVIIQLIFMIDYSILPTDMTTLP